MRFSEIKAHAGKVVLRPGVIVIGCAVLVFGCQTMVADKVDELPVEPKHSAEVTVAEPYGAPGDHVEDRLDIGRRAADDTQNLAGGRLLFQGLREVAVPGL